jgi:hypothetical protein
MTTRAGVENQEADFWDTFICEVNKGFWSKSGLRSSFICCCLFYPFCTICYSFSLKFSRIILGKGRCASFFFLYRNFIL